MEEGKNEPVSSLLHLIGASLSIIGFLILIYISFWYKDIWHQIGWIIFGLSLILLYLASTLYHFFKHEKAKNVFRRIDHSMIYVLIAGSYTAVCLSVLRNPLGIGILTIIWILAIIGISLKSSGVKIAPWLSTLVYVLMGWMAIIPINSLVNIVGIGGIIWLITGGVFYTAGVIFYSLDKGEARVRKRRVFDMHEIFHIFVLLGSLCHFWFVINYL